MSTGLPIAWLIARSAGLVAFGLLTVSVWIGLAMSSRLFPAKRTKTLVGLHRALAWTGLSMLVLHVGALLFDPVLHFNLLSVLVPGTTSWKPGSIAMGVVAAWVSLALATSFNARKWIGQKGWRRLHFASFGAFWLALGHAVLTGTDLRGLGGMAAAVFAAGPVLTLSFYRLLMPRQAPQARPPQPLAAAA